MLLLKNLVRHVAILGRDRIFREVDAVVDANLYRLGELVYEEENRAHLEAGMLDALEALLRRTPGQVLEALPPETSAAFCAQAAACKAKRARVSGGTAPSRSAGVRCRKASSASHTPASRWARFSSS